MGKGRGRGLLIVVGFALLGMVGYRSSPTALQDRLAFQRLAKAPMPKEKFDPLLKAAVLRHPAEPYLLLVGAQRAWQVRDDNPLPFLQRVFERSKTYGRAHLLLAEILFAKDAKLQALMELKYACRDEPGLATSAVALAIQHTLRQEELSRIVPPGPDGAAVLDTLGAWMHRRNRQVGESFDHQALALDPDRMGPRLRRASDIIEELSKKQEDEAAKTALGRKLEEHIRHIERVEPRLSHAARLRAQAFMAVGKAEKADQLLKVTCEHVPDRHACLQARVPILEALDRPEELDEVLEATAKAGCTSPQACARAYQWLGAYEQRRKSLGKAANAFQKVTRHDPQNADGWIRWGDVSMALGMHAQAIRAYEQAARLRPKDEGVKKKLQAAQGKVLGDLLNR
jgi:tetratricopeptide (TPR) repeat protein